MLPRRPHSVNHGNSDGDTSAHPQTLPAGLTSLAVRAGRYLDFEAQYVPPVPDDEQASGRPPPESDHGNAPRTDSIVVVHEGDLGTDNGLIISDRANAAELLAPGTKKDGPLWCLLRGEVDTTGMLSLARQLSIQILGYSFSCGNLRAAFSGPPGRGKVHADFWWLLEVNPENADAVDRFARSVASSYEITPIDREKCPNKYVALGASDPTQAPQPTHDSSPKQAGSPTPTSEKKPPVTNSGTLSPADTSISSPPAVSLDQEKVSPKPDAVSSYSFACFYLVRGFAVVPQLPGAKHPCVKWKPYQDRLPTPKDLESWFRCRWPEAGMAVILGPVSNLFAIDVDGEEAHNALVAKLGCVPVAPKVLSGSGKPFRYHLLFKHPAGIATRAKITPWHKKLEFRGNKGIIILPPSQHASGNCYQWAPGQSLEELELPEVPDLIREELLARAARDAAGHSCRTPASAQQLPEPSFEKLDWSHAQQLARAYIAKMPPAIQGQGGDKLTFTVACRLVLGFGLSVADAMPLLQEYSSRCVPPWSDEELKHKLEEADQLPGERGQLLRPTTRGPRKSSKALAGRSVNQTPQSGGATFPGTIPNFMSADWAKFRPSPRPRDEQGHLRHGRPPLAWGLNWLFYLAVVMQRCSKIIVPDQLLAQFLWGPGPRPRNWRGWLIRFLETWPAIELDQPPLWDACPECCPLHGRRDTPHRHFRIRIVDPAQYLGCLQYACLDQNPADGIYSYDFSRPPPTHEDGLPPIRENLERYRKAGQLAAVYLPARLFGPRAGLTYEQRNIIVALTREITRSRRSTREDKALIVVGGKPVAAPLGYRIAACPYLKKGQGYVAFTGNGKGKRARLYGRGLHLIGKNYGGWLPRAGFLIPNVYEEIWRTVRAFLTELKTLAEPFGLVVGGWHRTKRQWRSLEEMIELTRTRAGRVWLDECLVRVFAQEDYLIRWRDYFAQKLGFCYIPGDAADDGAVAEMAAVDTIATGGELARWMKNAGLSGKELAVRLGVNPSVVSRQRARCGPLSTAFRARLMSLVSAMPTRLEAGQPADQSI